MGNGYTHATRKITTLSEKVDDLKGQLIFILLHLVLFFSLSCFGVSCLVLEISAVEFSAFSQTQWD